MSILDKGLVEVGRYKNKSTKKLQKNHTTYFLTFWIGIFLGTIFLSLTFFQDWKFSFPLVIIFIITVSILIPLAEEMKTKLIKEAVLVTMWLEDHDVIISEEVLNKHFCLLVPFKVGDRAEFSDIYGNEYVLHSEVLYEYIVYKFVDVEQGTISGNSKSSSADKSSVLVAEDVIEKVFAGFSSDVKELVSSVEDKIVVLRSHSFEVDSYDVADVVEKNLCEAVERAVRLRLLAPDDGLEEFVTVVNNLGVELDSVLVAEVNALKHGLVAQNEYIVSRGNSNGLILVKDGSMGDDGNVKDGS